MYFLKRNEEDDDDSYDYKDDETKQATTVTGHGVTEHLELR